MCTFRQQQIQKHIISKIQSYRGRHLQKTSRTLRFKHFNGSLTKYYLQHPNTTNCRTALKTGYQSSVIKSLEVDAVGSPDYEDLTELFEHRLSPDDKRHQIREQLQSKINQLTNIRKSLQHNITTH